MAYTATPGQVLLVTKGSYVDEYPDGAYYPQRIYQWKKNGVDIPGARNPSYQILSSDVGSSLTVTETIWRIPETSGGGPEAWSVTNPTTTSSPPVLVVAGSYDTTGLIGPTNLGSTTYVGSFKLPNAPTGGPYPNQGFAYGAYYMGFVAAPYGPGGQKSLLVQGDRTTINPAIHISIPADNLLKNAFANSATNLNAATVLSPTDYLVPLYDNRGGDSLIGDKGDGFTQFDGTTGPPGRALHHIPGTNKILITATDTYGNSPQGFVYRRPLDISANGMNQIEGPVIAMQPGVMENPRAITGYICNVPSEWQTALDADLLMGVTSLSVIGATSDGPSLFGFKSSQINISLTKQARGNVQAITSNTITLEASASNVPDFYKGFSIHIPTFTRNPITIIGYDGPSRTAFVDDANSYGGYYKAGEAPTGIPISSAVGLPYKIYPILPGTAFAKYSPGQLSGRRWEELNPFWHDVCDARSICFPSGTKSILAIGFAGQGIYTYNGNGEITGGIGYQADSQMNGPRIWDGQSFARGPHVFPNGGQIWAFNVNDLIAVKNGQKSYSKINPYATWSFDVPYGDGKVSSMAYDDSTKRVYVAQNNERAAAGGVVHVYQINI